MKIEFIVECSGCGRELDAETVIPGKIIITAPACGHCVDGAADKGYEDGYNTGKQDVENKAE